MTARRDPYLRRDRAAGDAGDGWVTHPAGSFAGVRCEVAYDPRRHDIVRALTPLPITVAARLASDGWQLHATLDGGRQLWFRTRPTETRARLAELRCIPGASAVGR